MPGLPTTTSCYSARIAALQEQLAALLEQSRATGEAPDLLDLLEQKIQPLYAAIWAMHAELEQD